MPFIVKSKVKFRNLTGKVNFQCPVKFGIVQIGKDVDEMPISFVPAQLRIEGRLIIKGKVIINKGANLVVWPRATMTLGRYVMICSGVTVKAVENVTIGDYAMISSGCFIMDSNIHCIRDLATGNVNRPNNPIVIGDNVWMAMSAAALGGARIPSDSVLSRYSFVNKDITQWGGVFAGSPARLVRPGAARLISFDVERDVHDFFFSDQQAEFYTTDPGIEDVKDDSIARFFRI